MIIDLHTHTSVLSECSDITPDQLIEAARRAGLDGICFTEHNRSWRAVDIAALREKHDYLILGGMEVNTDYGHVLVFGLEGYGEETNIFDEKNRWLAQMANLRQLVDECGGALVMAHPLRSRAFSQHNATDLASLFDAMEGSNGNDSEGENQRCQELCRDLGLRMTGGSDTHLLAHVGTWATEFDAPIETEKDLVIQLKGEHFRPYSLQQKPSYPNDSLTLRVAEAIPEDVGKGVARLHPEDLRRLEIKDGDIVEIEGKKRTVARARPAPEQSLAPGFLQIDGIIRENSGTSLEEKVVVKQTECQPAKRLILTPHGGLGGLHRGQYHRYVSHLLEDMPFVAGDRVRISLFGTRTQDFNVATTIPEDVVLVQPDTAVEIESPAASEPSTPAISYEDVGGLAKVIERIREMVELPMKYPEVFERLGIEAPKGVLLHGPPGCGKTHLARAVASETDCHFIHINGPDIMHKFYGESEAHLRDIFEEASRCAPSIVFIDEIDAIAPKREEVNGEVEKRVVAQLLALMDGLKPRGQVIVIGATNIPNAMDPALRRPGRFDRELIFSIPDKKGRLEIMQIHTRGMPLASDVDLERLAQITHGFVGADLEALCREAAMNALRKLMPEIDFQATFIPYEKLLALQVTQNSFLEALKEVEPSAIREVFTEIPDVRWEDVGGLEEIKQLLQETIEWPLYHFKLFEYARVAPRKGILLTGPPGTGKTLTVKAVAHESEVNFISVKGPSLLSKWVGESERGVREVFKKARQASPCILFFDEIDALAPIRSADSGDSHVTGRVLSQFLSEMDGIEELRGVVVLAATNRLDIVDPALLRPGRFDLIVELPIPNRDARLAILKVHARGKPLAPDVDLATLADMTEGLVGADLEAICREATMMAVRRFLQEFPSTENLDYEEFNICMSHFVEAAKKVKKPPA